MQTKQFSKVSSGPMTILTILLIGVLIAAWKAPNWVRGIGFSALLASILWVTVTLENLYCLVVFT